MSDATAVLVVSCDSYRDVWGPFFTLLFRYWGDRPYPVFLGSNFETYPDKRLQPLAIGQDRDWSSNLLRMLDGIPVDGILLLQEDFLVDRPVDTGRIDRYIEYARSRDAACLRLMPIPGPDVPSPDHPDIGEIRPEAEYRVSLQAAWWNKEHLAKIARPGESPWQFERQGSRRSDALDAPFLSLREGVEYPLDYFTTAVVRGYWEPAALDLCRREKVPVDLRARSILPADIRLERALRRRKVPDRIARWIALPLRVVRPGKKAPPPTKAAGGG
jgi:hypothetical protein